MTWREVVWEDCQACKMNEEDAIDHCKWRKMIKDVWWSGWVWVGECFFWYWPTWVVPDQRPLNGCVCVCVCAAQKYQKWLIACCLSLFDLMHTLHRKSYCHFSRCTWISWLSQFSFMITLGYKWTHVNYCTLLKLFIMPHSSYSWHQRHLLCYRAVHLSVHPCMNARAEAFSNWLAIDL